MKKSSVRKAGAPKQSAKKPAPGKKDKPPGKAPAVRNQAGSKSKVSASAKTSRKPKAVSQSKQGRVAQPAKVVPQAASTVEKPKAAPARSITASMTPERPENPRPTLAVAAPRPAAPAKARADMPPEHGYSLMIDGHHKSLHDSKDAAVSEGHALKQRYPFLRVEVFDAARKNRTKVG